MFSVSHGVKGNASDLFRRKNGAHCLLIVEEKLMRYRIIESKVREHFQDEKMKDRETTPRGKGIKGEGGERKKEIR